MDQVFSSLFDFIDGISPSARALVPQARAVFGNVMFPVFALAAVSIKMVEIVLSNGVEETEESIGDLLQRILIVAAAVSFYTVFDRVYFAFLSWTADASARLFGGAAGTGDNPIKYSVAIETLWQLGKTIYEGIWQTDADTQAAIDEHVDDVFNPENDLTDRFLNLMQSIATFQAAGLMLQVAQDKLSALVNQLIWYPVTMIIIFLVVVQILFVAAVIQITVAAVFVLGAICIPFAVFQWSWANAFFFSWMRLAMFTIFAVIMLNFVFFVVQMLREELHNRYAVSTGTQLELFPDLLAIMLMVLLMSRSVGYSISLAQQVAGGGGFGGAGAAPRGRSFGTTKQNVDAVKGIHKMFTPKPS